jgi:hypothetical protein
MPEFFFVRVRNVLWLLPCPYARLSERRDGTLTLDVGFAFLHWVGGCKFDRF